MRIEPFVEIATPDHPLANPLGGGVKFAGHLLRDVLNENGGRYEATTELPDSDRRRIVEAARRAHDGKLASLIEANKFVISLEHLRDHDPDTTRIRYGLRLHKDPGDTETPGLRP